jgi:hypothetical protein
MKLANIIEKNQKLQHQIQAVALKITSFRTMNKFCFEKKLKNPRFYGKKN